MEHQAEQVQKMKVDVEMRDKILQDLYAWEEKMREEDAQYKLSRNSQIHSIDGDALYKAGKLEEALNAYAQALETKKDNITCCTNRALIFTRLER
ncbi:uncharacterized protein LOC136032690 isoform X2 [Artemia franciscana]